MNAKPNQFLRAMALGAEPSAPIPPPATGAKAKRERGTHIGGHFDRAFAKKVALLKIELELDTSQLIRRAIDELDAREQARRVFGEQ